jgi:hypothetical protein
MLVLFEGKPGKYNCKQQKGRLKTALNYTKNWKIGVLKFANGEYLHPHISIYCTEFITNSACVNPT